MWVIINMFQSTVWPAFILLETWAEPGLVFLDLGSLHPALGKVAGDMLCTAHVRVKLWS